MAWRDMRKSQSPARYRGHRNVPFGRGLQHCVGGRKAQPDTEGIETAELSGLLLVGLVAKPSPIPRA